MSTEATPGTNETRAGSNRGLPFPMHEGETVLRICRRHWLHLWPRVFVLVLFGVAPPALIAFLLSNADAYEGTVAKVYWVLAGLWLLYWGFRALLTWYRYNNDLWVITNQRLIDSMKTTPFNLRVATADLVNVQDLTVSRDGILRTAFDYGDIHCQTAAEQQSFVLSGIPKPREVQALIDLERDRERMRVRG